MIFDSDSRLLPGLLPGLYRGLEFFAPDVSSEHGRRVAEHLFPGVDRAAYDDHGLRPSVITIEGLLVGDDYQLQARLMQAAFERPGPGTLIHPWLGPISVILVEPAEISFNAQELRVARFFATFTRVGSDALGLIGGGLSTAVQLAADAVDLATAAYTLARSVR